MEAMRMHLDVYVPKLAALPVIEPGAGIIGSPRADHPGKLLIDYEDNRAGAINIRTYADRVLHAADRHLTGYPTSKRLLVDADDLLRVGTFDTCSRVVEVNDSETLESWLVDEEGAVPDLETQTRATLPPL
jgi:hypothetical protein